MSAKHMSSSTHSPPHRAMLRKAVPSLVPQGRSTILSAENMAAASAYKQRVGICMAVDSSHKRCTQLVSVGTGRRSSAAARLRAQKLLSSALARLLAALAEAPAQERRQTIEGLSEILKRELTVLREAQLREGAVGLGSITAVRQAPSAFSAQTDVDCARAGEDVADISARKATNTGTGTAEPRRGRERLKGNVWTVKTSSGVYHKVRLTLGRVIVSSRRLASRPTALRLLELLRAAAAAHAADAEERLRAVAAAAAADAESSSLFFQAVLDARRWLGSGRGGRITSGTLEDVEEVLALRRRVLEAEACGGAALCEEWRRWAHELRHTRGKPFALREEDRSAAIFAQGDARLEAHRKRCEVKHRRLQERSEARLRRLQERSDARRRRMQEHGEARRLRLVCRLRRLAVQAERALAACRRGAAGKPVGTGTIGAVQAERALAACRRGAAGKPVGTGTIGMMAFTAAASTEAPASEKTLTTSPSQKRKSSIVHLQCGATSSVRKVRPPPTPARATCQCDGAPSIRAISEHKNIGSFTN
eukprot:gnl/TRDRNA2_/TRDRNA2_126432_c1_seq1.p1 gnl/TRDRNA2_/TRDRNA2_126432_c1~~gnl/TRDRNA2_/TRDRNA2_126432_c1_seq1.p1  ORF type:complete len:536 (+),score=89.03 gnl/TRDRNA2_/TRDRNA2_126432_c1_seq1:34-1641(+)